MKLVLGLILGVVGALLAGPAAAGAFYGHGAQIVSADFERLELGDDSTVFAAISADGRYVAIQTQARNFFADDDPDPPDAYRAGGVFRFDLQTKRLEKVADGNVFDEASGAFLRRGASNPSISADGRYVAFVTAESLLSVDANDNSDVYVRDMAVSIGSAGAYDLVSVRDGGDVPATYGSPAVPFPGSEPGADLIPGAAISADGRRVAFRTAVATDLPASAGVDVPAGQILVRNRATKATTLVTAVRDPLSGAMTAEPAGGAAGAVLSADGTTVAWTGANANLQTRFLGGETPAPNTLYYLWRRIGDGPASPTRRVTGLADPDDPACPPGSSTFFNQTSTGPCYGPLTSQEATRANIGSQRPALSADGFTVAFLTGEGPRPDATTGPGLDLYVTSMAPGETRKGSTVELTRETVGNQNDTGPPLSSVAMAAGGRYLAATTVRTRFALPALQLLGEPRAIPGPRELYVIDLEGRTLERVTRATGGGDIDASVLDGPTISADGSRVAFASFAGNLFFGDANQRADAFVAERQAEGGTAPPPPPPGAGLPDATIESSGGGAAIRARARAGPDGSILLTVSVPAAGGVRAEARARAGQPRRPRTLAIATARARGAERSSVRLALRPVRRYRGELRRRGRIRARVVVTFVASRGGRRATTSIGVVFDRKKSLGKRSGAGQK
jgi:hypothetical protein